MANPTTVGFIITIDGVTIVDHGTYKASGVAQNAATANVLTYVLPNGTKINYDGTADSTTTPGRMIQDTVCTSGGATKYAAMVAKLGNYVTSRLDPLKTATGILNNPGTILVGVEDTTPGNMHSDEYMHIRYTIEVVGDWT